MSIDTKAIRRVVWRIITYSGRKYPVVSGFLIFVFFLYICFPLVFYYLICSSPVLVSTFVSIRFYFKIKYPEFQRIRTQNSDQRSYVDVNRSIRNRDQRSYVDVNRSIRNLKSVRRNARMEVPEWDRKDFEEMTNFSPRCSLFSNNKNALDQNSEFISSVEAENESGRGPRGGGVAAQVEAYNGGGDAAQVEEKEDAYNGGKRAMEDGQNNVMVLGTLESERNQRLESLMAKRRARKLFKMAVDQSLMKLEAILPPILTGVSNNPYEEILRMPGSAPSIIMAMENPFDIPYDPHEEKPDLMADSFQQEFMTANQKEFCRHESFRRGSLLTRVPNDAQFNHYYSSQRTLVEGPTESRFKLQSDKYEDGIEVEGEKMEVKMETDLVNNNDSCYTSSSDETEIDKDQMRKAFNLLVPPPPYDLSPSERPRPDFNSFYSTPHAPASTCSTASDLQVEVSEVGSPPLTTDGDSVSYDREDLSREANAQKLRELDDIIEEDSVQVDLSGLKRKFDDPPSQNMEPDSVQRRDNSIQNAADINRSLLVEQICDNSFSSPRSVLPQNNLEDVQKPQENHKHQLAENSIHRLSSNSSLDTSEGSCNTTEKTTDYKSADRINKLELEDTQGKADSYIPKTSKDAKELSTTFNESNTDFTQHIEGGSEKLAGHGTGMDPSESEEKNAKSDGPETMVVKEKEPTSSNKVVLEGNVVVMVNMKDERDVPVVEQSNAIGI